MMGQGRVSGSPGRPVTEEWMGGDSHSLSFMAPWELENEALRDGN